MGEVSDGVDCFVNCLLLNACAVCKGPASELCERAAQFGLEDDDESRCADSPEVVEQTGEHLKFQDFGEHGEKNENESASGQHVCAAGSAQVVKQTVDEKRNDAEVENRSDEIVNI